MNQFFLAVFFAWRDDFFRLFQAFIPRGLEEVAESCEGRLAFFKVFVGIDVIIRSRRFL